MEFIKACPETSFGRNNRNQSYFCTLEDQVAPDNPVRLMDTFIDKLEYTIIQTHNALK